ncbi:MFS transporter [Chloroflexota bacterium]
MSLNQKHSKVFYGWYIVAACLLITLYTTGVVFYGFTAVFEPIAEEFGWSYAQISLATSIRGLEVGLLAPLMGFLADRWGPRRLIFGGSILVCAGLLILSRVSSLTMFYGTFALIAIGMSTCTNTVTLTAVSNWFRRKAGVAIGIAISGVALGGILVPVVTRLVDILQWRTTMFAVGIGMLAIVLPLSLVIRHKPEHYGYHPDGNMSSTVETSKSENSIVNPEVNIPAKQALTQRAFWHVAISSMCQVFVVSAIVTHIMPYFSSIGITRSTSSLAAFILPVTSIGGRLSSSWLSDRFGSRKVFAVSFLSMTAGLVLFGYVTNGMIWLLVPFIITFGLAWGCSVTTRISLLREYFGRGSFGTILGFVSGIMMLGSITGAPIAGWVFDTYDSYKAAWLGFSGFTIVGSVLAATIPSSRDNNQQLD